MSTMAIERLQLAPSVLVGQSLGGLTALLVAARHPALVRALVLVDAGPGDERDAETAGAVPVAPSGGGVLRRPLRRC